MSQRASLAAPTLTERCSRRDAATEYQARLAAHDTWMSDDTTLPGENYGVISGY